MLREREVAFTKLLRPKLLNLHSIVSAVICWSGTKASPDARGVKRVSSGKERSHISVA